MTDLAATHPSAVGTGHEGSTGNQIVAMFASYDQARAARDALVTAGIERSRIELLDKTAAKEDASIEYSRNEEGFWASIKNLFMPEEDRHLYAEGMQRGHAVLAVRVLPGEEDRIVTLLDEQSPIDVETHSAQWRQGGWSGQYTAAGATDGSANLGEPTGAGMPNTGMATATPRSGGVAAGREEVIPVYEEQLRIGKREVGRGTVRVRSYVAETPVQEQVHLHDERVEIERRSVDRPVAAGSIGVEPFRERTIEVTATAEEAVVAKEMRVKEEIVVRKEEQDRTETVHDTVRHTEVEVEDSRVSGDVSRRTDVPPRRP